jgi:hypothetical protein
MTDQPEQITIDAEFQNLIRPLSDQERKELRESLSICGLFGISAAKEKSRILGFRPAATGLNAPTWKLT